MARGVRVPVGGAAFGFTLGQRRAESPADGSFDLGAFERRPGDDAWMEVRDNDTGGHVVADGLRIEPER